MGHVDHPHTLKETYDYILEVNLGGTAGDTITLNQLLLEIGAAFQSHVAAATTSVVCIDLSNVAASGQTLSVPVPAGAFLPPAVTMYGAGASVAAALNAATNPIQDITWHGYPAQPGTGSVQIVMKSSAGAMMPGVYVVLTFPTEPPTTPFG
jgi:hypothetical protein